MGKCNIDHSKEDVRKKFESQMEWLPEDVCALFDDFLNRERTQEDLNEMFHLLKKYDLAEEEEREERNKKMRFLLLD
ncbi:hypothetical protein ACFOU2_16260 [Bacillus songklensis]|uniref:Group-specific protein n=1 Tax=Bacillus songklensis TaxID=1069116 RepID=A0ABV8B3X2_9BACI